MTLHTKTHRFHSVDVPGGLHAGIWEPAGAPVATILAIHGITSSHKAWTPLARALPDHRIVAPDLRGRGRSNHLPGPWGMARHADDVAVLAHDLGVSDAVVVGHSMGGFVAVALAHRHPGLVDRLVLVDGGVPLPLATGVDPQESVRATLGPAAARLAMTFASFDDYRALWQQHPAFARDWTDDVDAYVRYDLQGAEPAVRAATSYEAMTADSLDLVAEDNATVRALAALTTPTTFLRAERGMVDDPGGLFPADHLAAWASRLPAMTTRDVASVNHYTITLSDRGAAAVADPVRHG